LDRAKIEIKEYRRRMYGVTFIDDTVDVVVVVRNKKKISAQQASGGQGRRERKKNIKMILITSYNAVQCKSVIRRRF